MSYSGLGQLRPISSYQTPTAQSTISLAPMAPPATTAYVPVSYAQTSMAPRAPGVVHESREPRYTRTEMAPPPAGRVSAPSLVNAAAQRVLGRPSRAPRLDVPRIARQPSLGNEIIPGQQSFGPYGPAPLQQQRSTPPQPSLMSTVGSLPSGVRMLLGAAPIVGGLIAGAYVGNKMKRPLVGAAVGGTAGLGLLAGYAVLSFNG